MTDSPYATAEFDTTLADRPPPREEGGVAKADAVEWNKFQSRGEESSLFFVSNLKLDKADTSVDSKL